MQKSNREQLLAQRRKRDAEEYGGKPDPEFFGADWTAHDAHLAGSASLAPMLLKLAEALEWGAQGDQLSCSEALAQLDAFLDGTTAQ